MTGARLVHDTLEQEGWDVEIADAQRVKGLALLACKTDKTDSLFWRRSRSAIWCLRIRCPWRHLRVRDLRELARFRMHLVQHKSALNCRIHSTLINFGRPWPSHRSVRRRGPQAVGEARGSRAMAVECQRVDRADRPPRARDRPAQPPPSGRSRRSSLHPAAFDRAGDTAGVLFVFTIPPRSATSRVPKPREAHSNTPVRYPESSSRGHRRRGRLTSRPDLPALGPARGDHVRAASATRATGRRYHNTK